MELTLRQSQSLLQAVNDKLFVLSPKIVDYERLPYSKGLEIVLRDLRHEQEDLRYVKQELEKIVYGG